MKYDKCFTGKKKLLTINGAIMLPVNINEEFPEEFQYAFSESPEMT